MLTANGRVIMISGANRGIGLATARVLAARGFRLSLTSAKAILNQTSDDLGIQFVNTT